MAYMSEYTIEGSFSIEATIPGPIAYSGTKARASLAIGQVVEAGSEDEARDMALNLVAKVTEDVKLHLAANAPGVTFFTDEYGVGQIGISVSPKEYDGKPSPTTTGVDAGTTQPTPAPVSTPSTSANGFTPLNHGGDRYTVQWNGVARTLFDNRQTKRGKQPDLKLPKIDGETDDMAFWIETREGGQNKAALALIHQIDESVPA